MRFKLIFIILFFFSSCTNGYKNSVKNSLSISGFAYIYDENDYLNKIVSRKFDNNNLLISHNFLRRGAIIKLSNPHNKKSVLLKNSYKSNYPNFYQILITEAVANKLDLNLDEPYVEIQEIKKNKSFIAGTAKTFNEEKKVHNTAPVDNVKIDNISKINIKKKVKKNKFFVLIGSFYSIESAKLLKNKLFTELSNFDEKNIFIRKKGKNKYELFSGPYSTVNSLKNDYTTLKQYGFEELEVKLND